jgi:hypothetical protein
VNLVSTPEIYHNEWASFSTRNFPQNRTARTGDKVWIVMLDVADARPVEDILWTDQGYQKVFQQSGFVPLRTYRPLGDQADAIPWVSEMTIAPWVIYALALA